MSQTSKTMRIDIPMPAVLRAVFMGFGLFVIGIATWEFHPGVWPLNYGSPFFLFIILGAWSVGIPAIIVGLLGWARHWTIERGHIRLRKRNPFGTEDRILTADDVAAFEIVEREEMDSPNSWSVVLVANTGERVPTYDVQSRKAAERVRNEIVAAFGGPAASVS